MDCHNERRDASTEKTACGLIRSTKARKREIASQEQKYEYEKEERQRRRETKKATSGLLLDWRKVAVSHFCIAKRKRS